MQEFLYEGLALAGCAATAIACGKVRSAIRKKLKKDRQL